MVVPMMLIQFTILKAGRLRGDLNLVAVAPAA
ncbi:hypothetical protein SAMN06266982_101230 [Propioniciclava tarda]|nr:hypothetical protein SAMN06266982_101230 [Propioniciclava tarda]